MPTAWLIARLSDTALAGGARVLGAIAKCLSRIGISIPKRWTVFVRPNVHILGDTFYSSAPLRFATTWPVAVRAAVAVGLPS
ncbi:hypothetical protein I541_5581 [Mycobacteroides abscessus]|nr:hypothetical protein I541_5581 [Mycobacteroides abscessus]